jgi:outer membrane protein
MRLFLKWFFFFFLVFTKNIQARQVTLADCIELALEKNPVLSSAIDRIEQVKAQIEQTHSNKWPVLSLQASASEQQARLQDQSEYNRLSSQQLITNINLSHNLFRGFKDTNLIKQKEKIKQAVEREHYRAVLQLGKDVAKAFYSILLYQTDINQYREQIKITRMRKLELLKAKKNGRIRDSDLLLIDSVMAGLEALISRSENILIPYQETLINLTGLEREVQITNTIVFPDKLKTVDQWLLDLEDRPDIRQAQNYLEAAEFGIAVAESGYYPTLGLSANYYFSRSKSIYQDIDWDVSLTLSLPFFSAGLTQAQEREARIVYHSQKVAKLNIQQLATQMIKTKFRTVESDVEQIKKLLYAAELSEKSYKLVRRDNRLGISTNTDVLTASQNWQESQRNLERSKIIALSDYVDLLIDSLKMTVDKKMEGLNE